MIGEDGAQLLEYDEMLQEMKQHNEKQAKRILELESNLPGTRESENQALKQEIEHVKGYYENLAKKGMEKEKEERKLRDEIQSLQDKIAVLEGRLRNHSKDLEGGFRTALPTDFLTHAESQNKSRQISEQQKRDIEQREQELLNNSGNLKQQLTNIEREKEAKIREIHGVECHKLTPKSARRRQKDARGNY